MPTIQYNKSGGGKIIYDEKDWLAGTLLTTNGSTGIYNKYGAVEQNSTDPMRKIGYIQPGFLPTTITNSASVTGYLRNAAVKGDDAIVIANDGKVHKISAFSAPFINTTTPFPHTIDHGHTGEAGSDIVNYYVGSTHKAFYSFHDDTDWDVGVYDYTADTFDDDFMSTVPATPLAGTDLTDGKVIQHPLIVGDDDILYMGSGRDVHAFDGQTGANGTFSSKVLTLPAGWRITCFAKTSDQKLAIGAYYESSIGVTTENLGEAKIWIWNYLDLDPTFIINLDDNYVSEIKNFKGSIVAFTSGRRTVTDAGINKLKIINGTEFQTLQTWNTGGLPIRGGVEIVSGDIYWNSGGEIYAYNKIPLQDGYSLNSPLAGGSSSSGMLKVFFNLFYFLYSTGTNCKSYRSNYQTSNVQWFGVRANPSFPSGKKGSIKSVEVTFRYVISDKMNFTMNTETSAGAASVTIQNLNTITNLKHRVFERNDGKALGEFTSLQTQLFWSSGTNNSSCPVVEKIEYEYELINI